MKEQMREIIIPEYMNQFQCIGSACEDTCCARWKVSVDKESFEKYRSTKHPVMKASLKENVKRNRSGNSDEEYAKIKMDSSGYCALLDENQLCTIQTVLGPEFLSNTCAIYPRELNLVDNVVEKSATLSCPEVARLVLLNEKGIEFIQDVEPSDTRGFVKKNTMSKTQQELFWDLRIFSIRILQDRRMTIEDRLIILGLFLRRFDKMGLDSQGEKLQDLMQEFEKNINDESLVTFINQLSTNISFQISLCKNFIAYRATTPTSSKRYAECFAEMVEGLGMNRQIEDKEVIERYKNGYEMSYRPFMEEHAYMLENYLVNYVFSNLFPFDKQTVTDSFAMLIINFSMIKLHLIGMGEYHKELTSDLVVKLVQSYSKTINHNATYLKNIENLMKESGYTTLAHMVVLVRS